jgi:hypothetical protein
LRDRGSLEDEILFEYYEKISVGGMDQMLTNGLPEIDAPLGCRQALEAWASGRDPRFTMAERTFRKYRKLVMDSLGVDISIPRHDQVEVMKGAGFDVDYLKARVVLPPEAGALQKRLFKVA